MSSQSNSPSTSKPPIRGFQYDSSSMGSLASAVNLFRGDFNLPQTLFTLPGRSKHSGLDLSVSLMYESSVHRDAGTWNREAPTGTLGLGWTLPLTWIEAQSSGSPAPETRSYVYYDNGSGSPLVQQPDLPLLFVMNDVSAVELGATQVPEKVRAAFLAHGLALSASSTLGSIDSQAGAQTWLLDDEALQQQFTLVAGDGGIEARAGGRAYQLRSYDFSQILYYEKYERWLIVEASGLRKSFGGKAAPTGEGLAVGVNNSIAWAVWWTDAAGSPVWTGPSKLSAGQTQVARAWYLASVSDRFGDSQQFIYNDWERGSDGLIPEVEQRVGAEGLAYTKAVYLTGLVDVFGRRVKLSYGDKQWSDDAREYADPHRDTPSTVANAYQDRYETKYLAGMVVTDTDGGTLTSIDLAYEVTTFGLTADYAKRLLTGVTMTNADGRALPGLIFEYFESDDEDGAQRGAMKAVTYPQGGRAQLRYASKSLDICDRTMPVSAPAGMPAGATPRVFYGPDYVVSTWYSAAYDKLSVQVFTWMGRWIAWQPDDADPFIDTQGIDLDSLGVIADEDFFALYFNDNAGSSKVYLFEQEVGIPGRWRAATLDGATTAKDQPSFALDLKDGDVRTCGGASFFVAHQHSSSKGTGSCTLIAWNWSTRSWTRCSWDLDTLAWVTAGDEYVFVVEKGGAISLRYLDGAQRWQETSGSITLQVEGLDDVELAPGAGMVAISARGAHRSDLQDYDLTLLRWNASYELGDAFTIGLQDKFASDTSPLPFAPQIVEDTFVAVNGNLLRFNGQDWLTNTALSTKPPSGMTPRYSYGPDFAVQILSSSTHTAEAKVLAFDADGDDPSSWTSEGSTPQASLTKTSTSAAGNDQLAVLGSSVYARGTATDWEAVFQGPALVDLGGFVGDGQRFDSQSLINEGPSFLAYALTDAGATQQQAVQVAIFDNGALCGGAPQAFTTERLGGTSAQGPQCFVSYDDAEDFDHATTIYLHRYAGDAVEGLIEDHPVVSLTLDDGFGAESSTTITYDYCTKTAACDASGEVVQYFMAWLFPGTDDPEQAPYGSTCVRFLNGLGDTSGDNAYDMLNGMQLSSQTLDASGRVVVEQTNTWAVAREISSAPKPAAAGQAVPTFALRGGWVYQPGQCSSHDGLTSSSQTSYVPAGLSAPFTGQPATKTTTTTTSASGSAGVSETKVVTMRYGVEVDDSMRALNLLGIGAGRQTSIQQAGGEPVIVSSTAVTFSSWASAIGEGVTTPGREAEFQLLDRDAAAFPFDTYAAGDTPAGWQLQGRILGRTTYGQVLERVDACGVHGSTLYSEDYKFMVAKLSNAGAGEFAYLGFEDYEDRSTWTLTGVTSETDDALTGTSAGRLAGTGASVSTTIQPANRSQRYVLSCWYQTGDGFVASEHSGCTLTLTTDGEPGEPRFVGFAVPASGDPRWRQLCVGVELDAGASGLELALELSNAGGVDVLVDSVALVPLVGGIMAKSYEPRLHQVLSLQDTGGRIRRTCYDRSARPVLQLGLDDSPVELSLAFLSRQGNADASFDPASPNAELVVHPAGPSSVERFRDGGAWRERWSAATPSLWSSADGELSFSGASADSLGWVGPAPTGASWAVYFEVTPETDAPQLSVSVDGVSVRWSAGVYSSTGTSGGAGEPLFAPPSMARHWLVVRGRERVSMFADGQLVVSAPASFAGSGLAITPSTAMSLRHLAVLDAPRIGINYQDGAGRQRQVQQLCGEDCLVGQIVYDAVDRQVAVTRCAPGSFGSGASLPPLQYRPGFVDEASFLADLDDSRVMPGDLADYYAGQVVDGLARSNDEGYAYSGTRWEASPRQQPLEYGKPGRAWAIADLATTTPDQRATTQLIVGTNDAGLGSLPAGQYQQNQVISPVKTRANQLLDSSGRAVAYAALDDKGGVVGQSGVARSYGYGSDGATLQAGMTVQLPNALVDGPQSGEAGYLESSTIDALGRTRVSIDPDAGTTQFVYDACGRLRFVQPELDAGAVGFIYYRYDRSGRMVEEGSIAQAWELDALEGHADDFDWPRASDGAKVAVTWIYDGSGDDPLSIGRKRQVLTQNPAPDFAAGAQALSCTETFTYDRGGHIVACSVTLGGATSSTQSLAYTYNNLGELLTLRLPEDAPVTELAYAYDALGQITAITGDGETLAAYTYTADGAVETETLGGGAWTRTMEYLSPGWVRRVQTASAAGNQRFDLSFTYRADGTYATREIDVALAGETSQLADAYTYDGQGRLASATGTSDIESYAYDPNGNVWSVAHGSGEAESFALTAGSDRLAAGVGYDGQGRVTALGGTTTLAYQDATGMSAGWQTAESQTQLGYGGHRQRVYKRVTDDQGALRSESIYLCGPAAGPIARIDDGVWTVYVQGPTGLVALCSSGAPRFPLEDSTGNIWALVDGAGGLVGRYDYLPFGATTPVGGSAPDELAYRFQGREWDAEVGLYNFGDRMYSPQLRRFLSPDPARQFPSPYVFAADNPLQVTDASGDISTWGQVGLGIAMGATIITGIAVSVVTFGAAAPAAGAADAAVVGAEAAADTALVAADAAATAAEGATTAGEVAAETGAEVATDASVAAGETTAETASASTEVATGASTTASEGTSSASEVTADTSTSWTSKFVSAGKSIIGSSISSAGSSGLSYDVQHGKDFSVQGFFEAVGLGALTGAITGGLDCGLGLAADRIGAAYGETMGFAAQTVFDGVSGALGNEVTAVITNISQHQPWYDHLIRQGAVGFAQGSMLSVLSAKSQSFVDSKTSTTLTRNLGRMATNANSLQLLASGPFYLYNNYTVMGRAKSWALGS